MFFPREAGTLTVDTGSMGELLCSGFPDILIAKRNKRR